MNRFPLLFLSNHAVSESESGSERDISTIDQFILAKNISNKRIRETLTFAIFNFLKSDLVTTLDNYSYACV